MSDAVGILILNEDGSVKVGPGTAIGHPVGFVDTGKSNGSVSDARLGLGGTPTVIAMLPLDAASYQTAPVVEITTSGLSWVFANSGSSSNGNCRILYGIA